MLFLRRQYDLTMNELCSILNIRQSTYSNWENGHARPSLEHIKALCDYFKVSADMLLYTQLNKIPGIWDEIVQGNCIPKSIPNGIPNTKNGHSSESVKAPTVNVDRGDKEVFYLILNELRVVRQDVGQIREKVLSE